MRMFWKRREAPARRLEFAAPFAALPPEALTDRAPVETVEVRRGDSRAAAISGTAEELRRRGEEVTEVFKEVVSPGRRAVLPIQVRGEGGRDVFIEVETEPWTRRTVEEVLRTVAVLRNSEHRDAMFEVLAAYPVPEEVRFFREQSPVALFQLDLVLNEDRYKPEVCDRSFRDAAARHWGLLDLDHDPQRLPAVEGALLAALGDGATGAVAPVLDALVRGFGCYAGEVLRRHATPEGSWRFEANPGEEGFVMEFPEATADPIGKARAFLENGPEDSVAYYVTYALEELNG